MAYAGLLIIKFVIKMKLKLFCRNINNSCSVTNKYYTCYFPIR